MERTMSVEEKIRRAEEIYEKRKQGMERPVTTVNLNNNKKDIKLLKKMIVQIIICSCIYFVIYLVHNSNYVFSEDFIKQVNEILSYDTNFFLLYQNIKESIEEIMNNKKQDSQDQNKGQEEQNNEQEQQDENKESEIDNNKENIQEAIGGAEEVEQQSNETIQLSQAEQDIVDIKSTTNFIKPLEGVISSKYGIRVTNVMPGMMKTNMFKKVNIEKNMGNGIDTKEVARLIEFIINTPNDVLIPEVGIKNINN